MSAYVPPSLRKKDEVVFPTLTEATPRKTFAEKAKEWEQQRIQTEIKINVEKRMSEHLKGIRTRAAEEDAYMLKSLGPSFKKEESYEQEIVIEKPKAVVPDDGWTVVQPKKVRKKKEFNYNEVPEELSSESEHDCWNEDDNTSSWN